MRRIPLAALLAMTVAMVLAPAAGATGDPVMTGSLNLRLSSAFKAQLAHHGVGLRPKKLSLKGGSLDPIAGTGSLKLRGRLTFKHGGRMLRLGKPKLTLGSGGALKAGGITLMRLRGGTLSRRGFGAAVTGVRAAFTAGAARKLTRELELGSPLRRGRAGALTLAEQPRTVEVLQGTATLQPASGTGSLNAKLAAHCIDPVAGMSVIAPAAQPAGPGTAIAFPITGGTISPIATDGVVDQSGGIQIANGGAGLASGCSATNTLTIRLTGFSSDLKHRLISVRAAVSGPGSPLGNVEVGGSFPLDISDTSVNPDPFGLALASAGTGLKLDGATAAELNLFFPQPSGGSPALELAAGDDLGTVGLSVKVR